MYTLEKKKSANFCRDNEKQPWDKCYNKQHHKFNNNNKKVAKKCRGFCGMQGLAAGVWRMSRTSVSRAFPALV